MHFDLEQPICQETGKPCGNIYVCRGYRNAGQAKYFGQSTVIKREDGLWEPTAWVTDRPPKGYHLEGMLLLLNRFKRISGTIEKHRLKAYERMFRGHFKLRKIKEIDKEYNGQTLHFWYVEFILEKEN